MPRHPRGVRADEVILQLGPVRADDDDVDIQPVGHLDDLVIDGALGDVDPVVHILEVADTEMKTWAKAQIPEDVEYRIHITEGTVYDQIIKVADRLNVDVIIVGSHRPGLKDYLIGPNAARVARHADQSVFVVR